MEKFKSNGTINIEHEIEKLSRNPLFKDKVITINNFNLMYNIMLETENCKSCRGLSECSNSVRGYRQKITDGDLVVAEPCKYQEDLLKKRDSKSLIKTFYMPKGILTATLDEFETFSPERKKAYQYSLKFINEFNRNNFIKGLYLYAPFGAGKTFLLGAIANELSKKKISSLLIYFPDLVRTLKASIGTKDFENIINELKEVDVLMIDDLGGEMLTSWLRDEIIGPILNYRVSEGLPLFISSNLDIDQLTNHFEQTKEEAYNKSGDTIKSGRIMERIKGLTAYLDLGKQRYSNR